jgi:hypothetical protein
VAEAKLGFTERDLRQWQLIEDFRRRVEALAVHHSLAESWQDPRRKLEHSRYLSLFLLALVNPILRTARALCAASHLRRVQQEISGGGVSTGSFSEAQHLADPALLEKLLRELCDELRGVTPQNPAQLWELCLAQDSSLWRALPRMAWAVHGGGRKGAANRAVRLHLSFNVIEDVPERVSVTAGRVCERKIWQQRWEPGALYIGDRYFAENYKCFGRLAAQGASYVLRLRDEAVLRVQKLLPLGPADVRAGVNEDAWVQLGSVPRYYTGPVRVITIHSATAGLLRLVTNLPPEVLRAAEVGALYRRRWQVECFFRWVKCLLGTRHWLSESQNGVTIELYLSLIAAVLLQLCTGRRPSKRMMELIQLHQMGWASAEEVAAGVSRELSRARARRQKS